MSKEKENLEEISIETVLDFVLGNIGTYQFAINDFYITKPNIQITNVLTRNEVICGLDNDTLFVLVQNNGMVAQNNIPVEVTITAVDWNGISLDEVDYTLTGALTEELEPGEIDTIFVSSFNSTIPGFYTIDAILQVVDNSNNTNVTIWLSVQQAQTITYFENFEGWVTLPTFYYTYNANFVNAANNYIATNNIYYGDEAYIITDKISEITQNTYLYFDYALNIGGMEIEDTIDQEFKPGLFREVEAFLNDDVTEFTDIHKQESLLKIYDKILNSESIN